jgi:YD repeat-containing protein
MTLSTSLLKQPTPAPAPSISRVVSAAAVTVVDTDKNKIIAVDTSANAVVLTLPSSGLVIGDTYSFMDAKANWGTTAASLASATFFGTAQTVSLDVPASTVTAVYRGGTIGWTVGEGEATFDNTTLLSIFNSKASLASPALTGVPIAPTAAANDNSTQVATTAFVNIANSIGSITSIAYNGSGQVTTINGVGWTETYAYLADGRLSTITKNGTTKTITYNSDGTIASII